MFAAESLVILVVHTEAELVLMPLEYCSSHLLYPCFFESL
ncbi:hypothetical protein GMES_4444 [Paraglaciecola mesophila KMM 241]|uniref:Uncharacterized protein n=1 Tax=Paraglaciecola mesophila KMM 241 TaxID=1128912 RepID=K6ZTR5_9ALTE|nr:hypothetical protein GMES_4444 [Paraglaciecola mesophila KMM 241]